MRQPGKDDSGGRNETDMERIDRNMVELLSGLRVALPGVQVLFAFLLVLPFNQGFANVTSFQKSVYLVTLLATSMATICLIAPTMHHRIQFREGKKAEILRDANRLTLVGMTALAVAMTGVVMLVTDYVFGSGTMIVCVVGVAVGIFLVWYLPPAQHLLGDHGKNDD